MKSRNLLSTSIKDKNIKRQKNSKNKDLGKDHITTNSTKEISSINTHYDDSSENKDNLLPTPQKLTSHNEYNDVENKK